MNTFGHIFRLTSFGESHGTAIGGVIDGIPAGIKLDLNAIQAQLSRRRPGQSSITTARNEMDEVLFLSGILNGVTEGTPIGFVIHNTNQRSDDYSEIATAFRPGHADYTYYTKYHGFNDIRGGGRSSARETASRIVAGAIASQILAILAPEIKVCAYTRAIGTVRSQLEPSYFTDATIDTNIVRCPDTIRAQEMERLIHSVKAEGDTIGGVVECVITGVPVGLGEPVFDKLSASMASAMMSINATKGFEIGHGFDLATRRGSEVQDTWTPDSQDARKIHAVNNFSGGIQGGLSNGEPIVLKVAFKPVATLLMDVETVSTELRPTTLKSRGRHDPCVVPRAVPIVQAMANMVILDMLLLNRCGATSI